MSLAYSALLISIAVGMGKWFEVPSRDFEQFYAHLTLKSLIFRRPGKGYSGWKNPKKLNFVGTVLPMVLDHELSSIMPKVQLADACFNHHLKKLPRHGPHSVLMTHLFRLLIEGSFYQFSLKGCCDMWMTFILALYSLCSMLLYGIRA